MESASLELKVGKEERARQRILEFMRPKPRATTQEIVAEGLGYALESGFKNIRAARIALGLDLTSFRIRGWDAKSMELQRERLLDYIRKHPTSTHLEIKSHYSGDIKELFEGSVDAAKVAAGVVPQGYLRAASAARKLHVTPHCLYERIESGTLGSIKIGRAVYVKIQAAESSS